LDLEESAVGVQGERNETPALLQTIHTCVDQHAAQL